MKTFAALPIALPLTLSPTLAGPSAADEVLAPVGVARGTFGQPGHEPLVVDDDSARGTAGGQPMVFSRVDGLWYLVTEGQ